MRQRPFFKKSRPRRSRTANRRRVLWLECLEGRIVLTQLQYGLFDTGVDGTGAALTGGATDSHYTLTQTQEGTAGMNAVVASTLASAWVANTATSAWIAPSANQGDGMSTSPPGTYDYQTSFNLASANGGNGQFTASVANDDNILDIKINGVSTDYTYVTNAGAFVEFRIDGTVAAGTNTIDFILNNTNVPNLPNPTGIQVKNLTLNFLPTITSQTATQTVLVGQTATNSGTFNEPDPDDTVTLTSNVGTVVQTGTNNGTYTWSQANITTGESVTITATNLEGGTATTTFTVDAQSNPPTVTTPAASTVINAANYTIIGTADAGSLVQIFQGSTVVGSLQLGAQQTSYSINVPLTQNAANNFEVTATDPTALQSNSTPVPTITEDSIAPVAPTITSPAAPVSVNATNYTVTGTAEAGSLVQIFQGQTVVGTLQLTPNQTTFSISVPLTQNAANNFDATATDAAGNQSSPATVPTITEDSIAPAAPTVTSPAAPILVNTTSSTITGTAEAGSLVTIYQGETVVGSLQLTAEQTTYSISVPLTANAANNFDVTATDAAGNQSSPTPVPTITEDSIAPAAPTITSPTAPVSVNATTYTVTGTAEAGSLVQIFQGETVVGTLQLTPDQTTFSFSVPLTANAANNFDVTATDAAGNQSSPATVPTITEDSIAPAAPTITSPAAPISINATSYTVTGTAEAGSLVTIYHLVTAVGTEQLGPDQTTFSINVPLTQNAANDFRATATDAAGNESLPATVPTITEDSIVPAAPTVTSPAAPIIVNATSSIITGTAEAGSLVTIYQGTTAVGTLQLTADQTTYSISVPLTANSANNFDVTATDAAGNQSSPTPVPTITEDSIAPAAPTVTSPAAPITVNATSSTITGTAEAGSLVTIYQGTTAVGTLQLTADQTTYSISVPLTANSANNFDVTATDAAGNQSSPTPVPTITEDSIAPVAPTVTGPATSVTVNATDYAITGTAEAGSLVTIYQGTTVVGTLQLAPGQTSYSISVPLTQDAANNFQVTSTDAAGNQSSPTAVPTIQDGFPIHGVVYQDLNADGKPETGEPGLAGRVVYLDLNHDGTFDAGDPTATTDANGNFSFPGTVQGTAAVFELTSEDTTGRYVVDQFLTNTDGSISIGTVFISPIAPVPVVPSPFVATPSTDPNTAYVESLYRAVLGREGEPQGVSAWVSMMNAGLTRQQVALDFINSPEHRLDQVYTYYEEFLHRAPDPGAAYWVNALLSGISEEKVVEGILDSPEYQSAHTDPETLVSDLYLEVLGRQDEQSPTNNTWLDRLSAGQTPEDIVAQFVESAEAATQLRDSFYAAFLRRPSEGPTADSWVTLMEGPNASATAAAAGILASDEFFEDAQKPKS